MNLRCINFIIYLIIFIAGQTSTHAQSSTMVRADVISILKQGYGFAVEHQFENRISLIASYQHHRASPQCFGYLAPEFNPEHPYLCIDNNFINDVGRETHLYLGGKYYFVDKPKGKFALGLAYSFHQVGGFTSDFQQSYFDFYGEYKEDINIQVVRMLIDYHYMFFTNFGLGIEAAYNTKSYAYVSSSASLNLIYKF